MSTTTRPNIASHLAHANGFDTLYKTGGIYGSTVISPMVRWLMTEANLHWLISDMLCVIGPFGLAEVKSAEFLTVRFDHAAGTMTYNDACPRTGKDVAVHVQTYESHDMTENLVLYITDHYDGDRPCKLVMVKQEY